MMDAPEESGDQSSRPPVPPRPLSARQLRHRREALVSLAFHSHRESDPRIASAPYFMRPIALDEAVDRMVRDPHVPSRVQATAWLLDGPHGLERRIEHIQRLIKTLPKPQIIEGSSADGMIAHLADEPPTISPRSTSEPSREMIRRVEVRRRAPRARARVAAGPPSPDQQGRFAKAYHALSGGGSCQRRNLKCFVGLDPETLVTSVEAIVEVNRPARNFGVLADARGWKTNVPLFWKRSDLGNYREGVFRDDQPELPPGSNNYSDRDLYECVNLSWNPMFPVQGDIVLTASHDECEDSGPGVTARMDVSLGLCLSTHVGYSNEQGGLDVDNGTTDVEDLGDGWTRLTARKQARFTERELCGVRLGIWMNLFAPFSLGPWMATLVYEGACAAVSEDTP